MTWLLTGWRLQAVVVLCGLGCLWKAIMLEGSPEASVCLGIIGTMAVTVGISTSVTSVERD